MLKASRHNIITRLEGKRAWPYVIVNPLAGNADFLNEEHHALLAALGSGNGVSPDDPRIRNLIARGYVDLDGEEGRREAAALEQLRKGYEESKRNLYVLVPSWECGLGCARCPQPPRGGPAAITAADLDRIAGMIARIEAESGPTEPPFLILYGGESLGDDERSLDLVKRIFDRYLSLFQRVTFYTAGFDTERYAAVFEREKIENVSVVFNIRDLGPGGGEGALRFLSPRVQAGIDFLRRRGAVVCLNAHFTEATVDQAPAFINAMMETGIAYSRNCIIRFTPIRADQCPVFEPCAIDYGLYGRLFGIYADNPQLEFANFAGRGALDRVQFILRSRDRFPPRTLFCEACSYLHIFDPRGQVHACYQTVGQPEQAVGDWRDAQTLDPEKLRQWRERTVTNLPGCQECPARYLCSGGCAQEALADRGSLYASACQPYREIIQAAFSSLYEDFMDSDRYGALDQAPAETGAPAAAEGGA
jgi:radical SAM protein with 4Fe4S-binding SPASM domain